MTATNHVLTGAVIGLLVAEPLVAMPAALVSHFLLDGMPHYSDDRMTHADRAFLYVLFSDMLVAAGVLLILLLALPRDGLLLAVCGVLAASPDLMWFSPWLEELKGKKPRPFGALRRFHQKIQWYTKPWCIAVELVWAGGAVILLAKII